MQQKPHASNHQGDIFCNPERTSQTQNYIGLHFAHILARQLVVYSSL